MKAGRGVIVDEAKKTLNFFFPFAFAIPQNHTNNDAGDWATIKIQSARLELAAAKGYAALGRYFNGNNDENEHMPSTVPLLVGFTRPENSTDNTGSDFVVGAWIPDSYQNKAPEPQEGAGICVERFSRESYFVSNWTGAPATAGTVAAKANELSEALDENKVRS